MTLVKIRSIAELYEQELTIGISKFSLARLTPQRAETAAHATYSFERVRHILWMLGELRQLCDQERTEKAMRWLGFIQGVLWAEDIYSIDHLKSHNMSDESETP